MSINKRWLAAAALVLAATASAGAQEQQQPQPSEFASWRVPGWTFVPGVTLGAIYDTNFALSTATAEAGRTDSDQVMRAAPFGQLEYWGRRTEFASGYRGYMNRYADVDQLNSYDQQLQVSLRRQASRRVSFYLQDSFNDVATTDEVQLNGVPFTRTGARANSFAAGVDARLTRYTDLAVRYDNAWVDFDRKENFLTNGWVNGVRTELSRRLSERAAIGGEYRFRRADLNEGTREMTFHDTGGTVRYALGPHTSWSAGGGVSRLEDKLTGDIRTGPYIRSSITHRGERATIGAAAERTFLPSFGFGGTTKSQEVRGFVQMPLTRNRLYVESWASWRRADPFIESELKLDTITFHATLGYAIARWLRPEFFYAYTQQDSEVTGGEIYRHRVGAQMLVSQPVRIR